MRRLIVTYLLVLFFLGSFSQDKTFNNWHFGYHCVLNFNSGNPIFSSNSQIDTQEGSASISDTLGNLLFYTDGLSVFDKNNNQMPNAGNLWGHKSSTQAALIVPNPIKKNLYYIFTTDVQWSSNGSGGACVGCLAYTTVDMNLNNGNGDAITNNTVLVSSVSEKLTGYKHQNDSSFWVVAHGYNNNNFYVFNVDSNGVNMVPIVKNIGTTPTINGSVLYSAHGQMKISPDGTKIGYVITSNGYIELFDFNNSNGNVSNPIKVQSGLTYVYGFEFSPNSKLIYVTDINWDTEIKQYNITNWNTNQINSSGVSLFSYYSATANFGQLQLAPNGKIYTTTFDHILYVINKPDVYGTGCQLTYSGINFPYAQNGQPYCKYGLPNHIPGFYKTQYIEPEPPKVDTTEKKCKTVTLPNVFTPNNDQINDIFKFKCNNVDVEPDKLSIYNRWGTEIYNSSENKNKLNLINDGIYFYVLKYQNEHYNGYIHLYH